MQTIQIDPRIRRVERALAENAAIDTLIAKLVALKDANIESARRNDSWCLKAQYEAAEAAVAVFEEDDLSGAMDSCADILFTEHRYSITEGRQLSRKECEL